MIPFPIVDAHLHVWDIKPLHYPWLDSLPQLNKSYLLDDYRQACGDVRVEKMVFLQAECDFGQHMQEAEWVTELAGQDHRIEGIVPWVPLEKGDAVQNDLEVMARNPLIKGIRRIIQFEEAIDFCLQPDFIKGVQLLAKYLLSFDICISHQQMSNTFKMVRQCPEVNFILDHIGKPDIKKQLFHPWKKELRELSEIPNVWCKMSGLVTEADMENWTPDDLKPYIEHVLDCFGFDRVLYGGDWPVACQATDYPGWFDG